MKFKQLRYTVAAIIVALACTDSPPPATVASHTNAVLVPPDDVEFFPFDCVGDPAFADDDPGSGNRGLDIVGDATYPALLRALDENFLYLRMRLDGTPLVAPDALE